jgi:triosephosphate isomerase
MRLSMDDALRRNAGVNNMASPRPFVAGNWKMNLSLAGMRELAAGIRDGFSETGKIDVAVCPPSPYLFPMAKALDGSGIGLGAQNVYHEESGAFTGEVSAAMLVDTGCKYVIIGHSERRHTIGHHEDDRMINLKVRAAMAAGLTPILCVGETIGERKAAQTNDVLTYQMVAGLCDVEVKAADTIVIAYEPVWAIGTGLTATPDQAQAAHAHIRGILKRNYGEQVAEGIRIQYGGSVKPDNAAELFGQPDVNGGLIGGASLKSAPFVAILGAALATVG